MAKIKNRYNQWVNANHKRVWLYDTPQTRNSKFAYKQCRGEYDEEKHIALINYFTPSLVAERKAQIQLQRYVRERTKTARCFAYVDNIYANTNAKVQCLFLSNYEPKPEVMSDIEKRIIQLGETAQFKVEDVDDPYVKKLFKQNEDEETDEELE